MNKVPDDEHFQERLYLLSHFEQYMLNKLNGMTDYNYKDEQLRTGMVFLTKYWRMKQVIAFRLSNESFQVREFEDAAGLLSADPSCPAVQFPGPHQVTAQSRCNSDHLH